MMNREQPGKAWTEDTSKPITIGEYETTKGKPHKAESKQKQEWTVPVTAFPPKEKPPSDFKKRTEEGLKYDDGKTMMELFPPEFFGAISEALSYGARRKYEPHNWRNGIAYSRLVGGVLRHLFAFIGGEKVDPESGLPHLWHLGCNVAFLVSYEADPVRYSKFDNLPEIGKGR